MHNIKSIIVFNGGSAGDFLKFICLSQIEQDENAVSVLDNGRVVSANEYFKKICSLHYNKSRPDLDYSKIFPVENSHHLLPWFKQVSDQLYFIDYPDRCQRQIVDIYIAKARRGNIEYVWHREIELGLLDNVHKSLQHKISQENIVEVIKINWKRNLRGWRTDTTLAPIQLSEFFDLEKFAEIVMNVSKLDKINMDLLKKQHNNWTSKNQILQGMFK